MAEESDGLPIATFQRDISNGKMEKETKEVKSFTDIAMRDNTERVL